MLISIKMKIEHALHKELIYSGVWPKELGWAYSFLRRSRNKGDYGRSAHVSLDEAYEALTLATRIIETVHQSDPVSFPL